MKVLSRDSNMLNANAQKGLSAITWMIILGVTAFFASVAFKIVLHYLDYMSLDAIILSVEEDAQKGTLIEDIPAFRDNVRKGMQVNGIRDIPIDSAIQVQFENNTFRVKLSYEKREPLIRNLSLIATFEKEYQLRIP